MTRRDSQPRMSLSKVAVYVLETLCRSKLIFYIDFPILGAPRNMVSTTLGFFIHKPIKYHNQVNIGHKHDLTQGIFEYCADQSNNFQVDKTHIKVHFNGQFY